MDTGIPGWPEVLQRAKEWLQACWIWRTNNSPGSNGEAVRDLLAQGRLQGSGRKG